MGRFSKQLWGDSPERDHLYVPFSWSLSLRPRLLISDGTVKVVGPLSTSRFALDDLVSAEGGRILRLRLRDGSAVSVWAVQSSNFALWTGGGRAWEVALELTRTLGLSRPDSAIG